MKSDILLILSLACGFIYSFYLFSIEILNIIDVGIICTILFFIIVWFLSFSAKADEWKKANESSNGKKESQK